VACARAASETGCNGCLFALSFPFPFQYGQYDLPFPFQYGYVLISVSFPLSSFHTGKEKERKRQTNQVVGVVVYLEDFEGF
jgi:hypothetical protein